MKRTASISLFALAFVVASCAPTTQQRDPNARRSGLGDVDDTGNVREATPEGGELSDLVKAPSARVFEATLAVFQELGIDMPRVDRQRLMVQNPDLVLSRTFLGRPLSSFLRCGNSMTGPNADSFRIRMHILTSVKAEGSGSRLGTRIEATATNPRGTSNAVMDCSSTFAFEKRILEMVRARVAMSG